MTKRNDRKTKLFFVYLDTNECTEGNQDCGVNAERSNTLGGLTTALVKMDMREMEPTAQVSQKPRYQTMFSQLKNVSCQTN